MNNGDLIRRVDAMDVVRSLTVSLGGKQIFTPEAKASVINAIDYVLQVDAVEIIRCRDCTHYGESPYHHPTIGWCIIHGCHKFPDYFCADADRRVEG